jgi:hypothetical protein
MAMTLMIIGNYEIFMLPKRLRKGEMSEEEISVLEEEHHV